MQMQAQFRRAGWKGSHITSLNQIIFTKNAWGFNIYFPSSGCVYRLISQNLKCNVAFIKNDNNSNLVTLLKNDNNSILVTPFSGSVLKVDNGSMSMNSWIWVNICQLK